MQPTNAWSLKDFDLVENHVSLNKITMSDLSSPTGQKNLCKTYNTFFGGVHVRDVPTSLTLHSRLPLLFLDFLSPISPVSTPFGRGGGGSGMSQPPVLCIPGCRPLFLDFLSPISSVSTPFGRGGGVQECPNLSYFAFPASGLFFLASSVPLAPFRLVLRNIQ